MDDPPSTTESETSDDVAVPEDREEMPAAETLLSSVSSTAPSSSGNGTTATTPLSARKDALLGRLSQWRKNNPVVENIIAETQRRVINGTTVFVSPLSKAQLSPAAAATEDNNNNQAATEIARDDNNAAPTAIAARSTSTDDDDDEEEEDSCTSDSSSFVSRSTRTSNGSGSFVWAAASVVENMPTNFFRGRYAADNNSSNLATTRRPSLPPHNAALASSTQLSRMLSSTQQEHIQALLRELEPHQYVMLLGRGMLGVNLKQSFLKDTGVYVDFLVKNGAADQTKHVWVGDLLQNVGSASVQKGTIAEIPQIIATSRRPLHLIWATGTPTAVEQMSCMDVCVALMQQYRMQEVVYEEEDEELEEEDDDVEDDSSSSEAHAEEKKSSDDEGEENEEDADLKASSSGGSDDSMKAETGHTSEAQLDLPDMPGSEEESNEYVHPTKKKFAQLERSMSAIEISFTHSVDTYCKPELLPLEVRQALQHNVTKRNHDGFDHLELLQAAGTDKNFYAAIQHAFVECVTDGRRFPFLARHLSMEEEETKLNSSDQESSSAIKSPNAMLMLFYEMVNFMDLYNVSTETKRYENANRIAYKFFLPTRLGKELIPPMFDYHHIASDASLRKLEAALKDEQKQVPRDVFMDFASAAMDILTGYPFVSFLASAECARMRAYLRNVAPFVNVPLDQVLRSVSTNPYAKNYLYYLVMYLLCQTDKEGFGEHDELLSKGGGVRVEHAVSGICAALFIQSKVVPTLEQTSADTTQVIEVFEQLWEHFVDPNCGALEMAPHAGKAKETLKSVQTTLKAIQSDCCVYQDDENEYKQQIFKRLTAPEIKQQLSIFALELVFDYAANVHPKFREHKFHEWLCTEIAASRNENSSESDKEGVPKIASGCIKRLLRKTQFPSGLAPHKPIHCCPDDKESEMGVSIEYVSSECAIVFGTTNSSHSGETEQVQRFACQSVVLSEDAIRSLAPEEVPTTLESYASLPPLQPKPFATQQSCAWTSVDGWDVTLQSFIVPRSESGEENPLYGCALVFQKANAASLNSPYSSAGENKDKEAASLNRDLPLFNKKLVDEETWSKYVSATRRPSVGIALVSQRNTILSMRDTLSRLFQSFTQNSDGMTTTLSCSNLVDILGNFRHDGIEPGAMVEILRPFILEAGSPWLGRPLSAQRVAFEQMAGRHLIQSLPPIALALLFVTALLEQKIVFTSSRRSLLLSATTALKCLLKPLRWWHLLVPCVPSSLAGDLLQYPAPFILGMSSEDPGIMGHIRELPKDVTLVDLDVGRVILASSFAHDSELGRGVPNDTNTTRIVRQQVLYMSQALGAVFGSVVGEETWACDRPDSHNVIDEVTKFDNLCNVCHDFTNELLAGTTSCCYWIEEDGADGKVEPTILFDEDRFFHVKNLRESEGFSPLFGELSKNESSKMAIALEDFDLILEVFLRCQSMNVYIGSRKQADMALSV
jgi:hypothetical protein